MIHFFPCQQCNRLLNHIKFGHGYTISNPPIINVSSVLSFCFILFLVNTRKIAKLLFWTSIIGNCVRVWPWTTAGISVAYDRGIESAILSLITSFFHSFILKNELQFFCLCIDSYTLNFYCAFIVFCYRKWWKRNCYMLQLKDMNHFISKWKLVIVA